MNMIMTKIIMIIVMMMTDYDNDNSHDADEHGDENVYVWSARPGHSLPAGPCESLASGPSNSPTHQNTKALPDQPPSRTLPAAIRRLLSQLFPSTACNKYDLR